MSEDSECEICYEKNAEWTCDKCRVKCCWSCLYECIVHTTKTDPTCPKCDSILSMKDIYACVGKSEFKKTYLERLYRAELDHELQHVPELMPYCLNIAKIYNPNDASVYEQYLCDINDMNNIMKHIQGLFLKMGLSIVIHKLSDIEALNPQFIEKHIPKNRVHSYLELSDAMPLDINMTELINVEIPRLHKRSLELNEMFGRKGGYMYPPSLDSVVSEIASKYYLDTATRTREDGETNKPKEPKYIFKCPNAECKGFVNRSYFCELCETKFCKDCFAPLKEGAAHSCKEEDIATMKEIMKNTKPCPKCKSRIYRSSGCSQMFCTHCHTGFDWNTGEIIVGSFHNPHRIEWLQTLGIDEFNDFEEDNCDEGIIIGYYPSSNAYYLNYQYQIRHYRRFIEIINRSLDGYTYNPSTETHYAAELIKYVLGWSKNFEKLTRTHCLGDAKKRYLRLILNEYTDSMEIVMRAIIRNSQQITDKLSQLYVCGYDKEEVKREFFRNLCEERCSSLFSNVTTSYPKVAEEFKAVKEHFNSEMNIIHEITDNANKELKLYKEIFGLKNERIIYDDREVKWRQFHDCGNAPMQTHKI